MTERTYSRAPLWTEFTSLTPALPAISALLAWLTMAGSAVAADIVPSAFGTLGYAQSNSDQTYERFINKGGTWDRDSVFGLQLDARMNAQWSATVQLRAAPSLKSDSRWELRPTWAFVAWRPSDDWLLRAGRLRAPLYMYSESLDVGVTHDMARLPTEMYSLAPSSDFDGLSAGKTWQRGDNEYSIEGYYGQMDTTARTWLRDGVQGGVPAGAFFTDISVRMTGLVFTLRQPSGQWRASWHRTFSRRSDGSSFSVIYPFVSLGSGLGYYQVSDQFPGPGVPTTKMIRNDILTLGVEQSLPAGMRGAVEISKQFQHDITGGSDFWGGYVALFRPFGSVTPYVCWSILRSSSAQLDAYDNMVLHPLPDSVPGAALINAAQRVAAEGLYANDQHALAVGAAWSLSPKQKIKVEWKRTYIGRVSRMVDTLPGTEVRDSNIDTVSVNYNFAF